NYLLSILMGFLWAVNPSLGLSNLSTVDATVFACIPWIILTIAQFMEAKKWGWWIAGVFSIAVLNSAYGVNYPVRVYFMFTLIFVILTIWYLIQDIKNIITVIYALLIAVMGLLMTSFVWVHILEAANFSGEQVNLSINNIVNSTTISVPPGHLINLFIPNFNGSMGSVHAWGDGLLIHSAHRNLMGGIFSSFSILFAIITLLRNKKWKINLNKKYKIWLIISLSLNILMLTVMMGRYTFVFTILGKILPWIFLIPYPFYFHFAHHFATFILIMLGLAIIVEYSNEKKEFMNKVHPMLALFYTGLIILFIVIYLFASVPFYKKPAYKYLTIFNEWLWFLTNPIRYFISASIFLIIIYSLRKKYFNFFKYTMITAVFLEAFFVGYICFYKNMVMPRALDRSEHEKLQRTHYTLPGKHPFFSQINEIKKISDDDDSRWASDLAVIDSLGWITNGKSLGGYDVKPILTNMRVILQTFYSNIPYQMVSFAFPKMLMSNLNAGYIVKFNSHLGENFLYEYNIDGVDFYYTCKMEKLKNVEGELYDYYFKNFKEPFFKIYKIEEPMPYIYFQNRIFSAEKKTHRTSLYKEDLRKFALLLSKDSKSFPDFSNDSYTSFNTKDQFTSLQTENRILNINRKYYNKLKLKVNIKEPVLMVRNEIWHPDWKIFIDGKRENIMQVNYMLQGVFLKPGNHEIEYIFFPNKLKTAFIISLITISFCIGLIIFIIIKKQKKR
ncbi:MAG: hypothetical protein JXB50_11080, partial [Spirochaetes bacterium]|nr:hypothetical protein [Spirochaetota bacterium]